MKTRGERNRSFVMKTTIAAAGIAFMMLISSIPIRAASTSGSDWTGYQGNYPFNFNYSSQTQINSNNVQNLQLSWVFPVPGAPPGTLGGQSVIITPIVVNGIVYSITDYHLVMAMDARDGKTLWAKQIAKGSGHYHSIWYSSQIRNQPLLWIVTKNFVVLALNALTGDTVLNFTSFSPKTEVIPGSYGIYSPDPFNMVINDKGGIIVLGMRGADSSGASRGYFMGWDVTVTPPKKIWTTFMIPPQDGSDPSWAINQLQSMSGAWIFEPKDNSAIDLKSMSATSLHDLLYGDWGNFGFNGTRSFAGAGAGWGGNWALDTHTGIAYVGTAQPGPDWNASSNRNGPNLWSDSVLAIDSTTGKLVWGFQTDSHDINDLDCSWGVILANATIAGQTRSVVIKGCKNGHLYELDPATGRMFAQVHAPSHIVFAINGLLDPLSKSDMTKPWPYYPSLTGVSMRTPGGGLESNPAFDPTTNTIFAVWYNSPVTYQVGPVGPSGPKCPQGKPASASCWVYPGGSQFNSKPLPPYNLTLWAYDANGLTPKWHYFVPNLGFRGGLTVTGGMVVLATTDGVVRFLSEQDGSLLLSKVVGGEMDTEPAVAADANGNIKIIEPVSGPPVAAGIVLTGGTSTTPGFLFALAVPAGSAAATITATTTTAFVTTTAVSTVAGPSTGIDPTTFYGAVGLAVVFIIATGILAVRGRKPAS